VTEQAIGVNLANEKLVVLLDVFRWRNCACLHLKVVVTISHSHQKREGQRFGLLFIGLEEVLVLVLGVETHISHPVDGNEHVDLINRAVDAIIRQLEVNSLLPGIPLLLIPRLIH